MNSWRCLSLVVVAVLMFVIGVPLNLFVPHRRPEDLGLQPDGDAQESFGHATFRLDARPALDQRYAEPSCSLDGQFDGKHYCFFQSGSKVSAARLERPGAVAY
jgi:hypothetical protein